MGDGLESQAAAFKSFMASKEEKGEKNDMFFGTMSKEEREKEDRDAAAPSKEDVKEESEKDKKKKKKLPKPPPVIEDEKALKKRNVKRDMLRLRKSGAADGLRGQSQMETLRHEFQKRTRHVAEKNLAKALKKTKQFEMRRLQRNIKTAGVGHVKLAEDSEEDEVLDEDEDKPKKKKAKKEKKIKTKADHEAALEMVRNIDTQKLAPMTFEFLTDGTKLNSAEAAKKMISGLEEMQYKLVRSKHVSETWAEHNPDKQVRNEQP